MQQIYIPQSKGGVRFVLVLKLINYKDKEENTLLYSPLYTLVEYKTIP